jgi:hypothetical protein
MTVGLLRRPARPSRGVVVFVGSAERLRSLLACGDTGKKDRECALIL